MDYFTDLGLILSFIDLDYNQVLIQPGPISQGQVMLGV